MKVWYSTNFSGYYPVGVAAIVVAETQQDAYAALRELLDVEGLLAMQFINFKDTFTVDCVEELLTDKPVAIMLCNGDY